MPYIRKKKRRMRYGWAIGIFFGILVLWAIGIRIDTNRPWIIWRKENSLFHGPLFQTSNASKPDNAPAKGLMGHALKSLPKEGVAGYSKDKIMKAYREGKINASTVSKMDPKVVEEYRKKMTQS